MIDHAHVARDVIISASVTGTTATLVVNTTVTTLTAATAKELRASLVRRVVVVATAIDLPVQVRILTNGRDEVLLVAPDGETEAIGALLPEQPARSTRVLPAFLAAVGVTAAALAIGLLLVPDGAAPGRSPVTAAVERLLTAAPDRLPATVADRERAPRPLQRGAEPREVSSGPARADGLDTPVEEPLVEPAPPTPTTDAPVETAPVSTASTNSDRDNQSDNNNGPADQPEPPAPVDPDDVPDPVDPDDL